MEDEQLQIGSSQCWLTIENRSDSPILVRKYKKMELFSEQRVYHPDETGIITEGANWDKKFLAKVYTIGKKLKKKQRIKLKINKIYKLVVYSDRCSCTTIKPKNVDLQLMAYQRMEEIWETTNYYETLRIPQTATKREIRVAYLKLAKQYHPDHNKDPNAELMFERIVEAYNTLSDDETRKQYDTHLRTEPGVLSKSYWRQVFCVWNKHKAVQVGLSTLFTLLGTGILLTSILALPTGIGIPASVVCGGIGGGLFASGVGGLSVALSSSAALEQNLNYKRWLKYSFWYGLAGCAAGSLSAGIGGAMHPIVGGFAGLLAAASVKGAATGICFTTAKGIASEKWKKLITRLRVDAIALDLVIGTITGAAFGVLLEGSLVSSKVASIIGTQAKMTTKSIKTTDASATTSVFSLKKSRSLTDSITEASPLLLLTNGSSSNLVQLEEKKKEESVDSHDENLISKTLLVQQKNDIFDEPLSCDVFENNSVFDFNEDKNCCTISSDVKISCEQENVNIENLECNTKNVNESSHSILHVDENHDKPDDNDESLLFDLNDSIVESLNENPTVEDYDEAITLFEMYSAQPHVQHIITFHNLSSFTKVRMFIEYTTEIESNELKFHKQSPPVNSPFYVPVNASNIQVYFEHSRLGIKWEPVCSVPTETQHVFYFQSPVTRRFFASICNGEVRISQIRNEFEQCIRIT